MKACRKSVPARWIRIALLTSTLLPALSCCLWTSGADEERSSARKEVVFTRDIAPLVFENCAVCHQAGGSAPFSLLSYQEVKKRAQQIAVVTGKRYMPPWLPERGYGEFLAERRLEDEEIERIREWVDQGTVEGDPSDLPPVPEFRSEWQLGQPDLVVSMPESYTLPASGTDLFRNFVIPAAVPERRYVEVIEIDPGESKKVIHHANILIDRTGSSRRLDDRDPDVGFAGMDLYLESPRFEPQSHFLFWKPGSAPVRELEGMSWPLDRGNYLVLNMHMQPSGKPEVIEARIGLYFTDRPPARFPMLLQLENDAALDIPPGEKEFVVTAEYRLPVDVEVIGIYPHAHYLGKDLQGYATPPDGVRKWLIWIRDWDFNWQAVYRYKKPFSLPKGTVLSMRYTYDNSAENPRNPNQPPQRVRAGNRSTDEMAHLWIQVLPSHPDGRLILQETLMRDRLDRHPRDYIAHSNLGAVLQLRGRLEEAVAHFRESVRIKPDDAITRNNLGAALQALGKVQEALEQYREAVRLDPGFLDAHYNLGSLLLASGQVSQAIGPLRRVVEANPDDAASQRKLGQALLQSGDTKSALQHYQRALRANPNDAELHNELGYLLAARGELDQAKFHLQRAVELAPKSADAHNNLGIALAMAGDLEQAAVHFEEALRIDPNHNQARANLKRAKRGARP